MNFYPKVKSRVSKFVQSGKVKLFKGFEKESSRILHHLAQLTTEAQIFEEWLLDLRGADTYNLTES